MVTYTVLYFLPISILTSKLERLYQIEHPQIVAQFDEVNKMEEDSKGYWISKPWLKGLEFEAYYF
jgi:ubiquitin carboxyl-terminal hydrolase 48